MELDLSEFKTLPPEETLDLSEFKLTPPSSVIPAELKPPTMLEKIGGAIKSGLKQSFPTNPLLGTNTGQKLLGGAVKMGAQGLKPAITPFAMVANKDLDVPLVGKVKSNPTPGEALLLGAEAGLSAVGLNKAPAVIKGAKALIPQAKTAGEKALSLTTNELAKVDKSKLKYLGEKGLDMIHTEKGIFKDKVFQMTDEVKNLSKEFSHLLNNSNPEKNIDNVISKINRLQKESKTAFEGVVKNFNAKTLASQIKKSVTDIADTGFESMAKQNQTAYVAKRMGEFMKHVKKGTLEGLDDALEAFRKSEVKGDQTLSKANDVIYKTVKKYIVDNLPTDKATVYKAANTAQAKLFDVTEILKGKIEGTIGGSLLKKSAIVGGIIAGAGTIYKAGEAILRK